MVGYTVQIALLAFFFPTFLVSGKPDSDPEIKNWLNEVSRSGDITFYENYSIAMVKSLSNSGPVFFKTDYTAINRLGFLQFIGQDDWNLFKVFNPNLDDKPKKWYRKSFFRSLNANKVLFCKGSKCKYLTRKGRKIKTLATWRVPSDLEEPDEWLDWWVKKLGYSGVVLDCKGDLCLVSSLRPLNKGENQAIAISNSNNIPIINQKKQKGSALLKRIKSDRHLAIFKVIAGDGGGGEVTPGTKIIIDEKKKKKRKKGRSSKKSKKKNGEEN